MSSRPRTSMSSPALARVVELVVHRGTQRVLDGVSETLCQGEVVAIMGENGSGKTTLIEAFAGLLPLRSGDVIWAENGNSIVVRDSQGRRNQPPSMGLTLQKGGVCGDETVMERISVSLSVAGIEHSDDQIMELLSLWGLEHRANDRLAHLSGGLRRRVAILGGLAPAALSNSPLVVLLDEPSEGLDDSAKDILRSWIRSLSSRNHAILMATHDKDISSSADRVLTIRDGSIEEQIGKSLGEICDLPQSGERGNQAPVSSLVKWSVKMEVRNPIELLSGQDFQLQDSRLHASLILAPAFIAAVSSPALVQRLSESDCGRWWNAVAGPIARPALSITGASILLPIPITYLSWAVLSGTFNGGEYEDVAIWLWIPALALMDLAIAATALHLLVSDLSRSSSAPAPLILIVLVWPFLELTDALSSIMDNGMSWSLSIHDPVVSCIVASLISALVWLAAVMIPDY